MHAPLLTHGLPSLDLVLLRKESCLRCDLPHWLHFLVEPDDGSVGSLGPET